VALTARKPDLRDSIWLLGARTVAQAQAEEIFFNQPLLMLDDLLHRDQEARYHALGKTLEGRLLHVTFTLRGGGSLIRVISARDMHRKERSVNEQAG
jgi:uncharacterized DUF497 family protein